MTTTDILPQARLEPGETLGDRYRLGEPLDASGKGRVFGARDLTLGRDVAIKVLGPSASPLALGSQSEGEALARLSHPNVAEIFDVTESDGLRFVVMELVPGDTLAAMLATRGPLSPPESVRLAVQIAEGISAVHRLGIVHCDVKPANVVVTPAGAPKLVDFGTARLKGRDEADRVVGSAPYIAPERITSRDVDGRADVYSLGATLYELLTGRPPLVGRDDDETLRMALRGEIAPPSLLNREIPDDLSAVVMKALSRDPEQRYPTALSMASALRTVGSRLRAASAAATSDFARPDSTVSLPILRAAGRSPLGRRALAAAGVAALLFAVGLWGVAGGSPLGASPVSASVHSTPPPATSALSVGATSSAPVPTATATAVPTVPAVDPTAVPSPTPDPTQTPTSTPTQTVQMVLTASTGQTVSTSNTQPKPSSKPAPKSHRKHGGG